MALLDSIEALYRLLGRTPEPGAGAAPVGSTPVAGAAIAAPVAAGGLLGASEAEAAPLSGIQKLTHWGDTPGLTELDPSFYGRGIAGAEARRKGNAVPGDWVDRTYYGLDVGQPGGYTKEPRLGQYEYRTELPGENIYDFREDPLGLKQKLTQEGPADRMTEYERIIRDAGYDGYYVQDPSMGKVAAIFRKLPVTAAAVGGAGLLGYQDEAEAAPFGTLAKRLGIPTEIGHHGSPHGFDPREGESLLFSKIGTGEGAQAYAYGPYGSFSKAVADDYRLGLSQPTMQVGTATGDTYQFPVGNGDWWDLPEYHQAVSGLQENLTVLGADKGLPEPTTAQVEQLLALSQDALGEMPRGETSANLASFIQNRITALKGRLANSQDVWGNKPDAKVKMERAQAGIDRLEAILPYAKLMKTKQDATGFLYDVEVPKRELMLNWDATIGNQPEAVKEKVKGVMEDVYGASTLGVDLETWMQLDPERKAKALSKVRARNYDELPGQMLYQMIEADMITKHGRDAGRRKTSEYLAAKGIPGTVYRGIESGQHNFVLFGDRYSNVVSKNGEPFGAKPGRNLLPAAGAAIVPGLAAMEVSANEPLNQWTQRQVANRRDTDALRGVEAAGAIEERAQARAGTPIARLGEWLAPVAEKTMESVRGLTPFPQAAETAAEFTGLPGLARFPSEWASGDTSLGTALDAASIALPVVGAALKGGKAARALGKSDEITRPGAEGYRGVPEGALEFSQDLGGPRVEMPRLTRANKGRPAGTPVGLPPGVPATEEAIEGLADAYAQRVMDAMEAGVEPGYFYQKGHADLSKMTGGDRPETVRAASQFAVTSPQAPVSTNAQWAVRGREQQAMGLPVTTGKSPRQVRQDFQTIEEELQRDPTRVSPEVGGPKTGPFGRLLAGEESLAPNDRWEMFGIGYPRNASFTATERRMADYIRQRAVEKLRERGVGLSLSQAQELHWQRVRGPETGTEMIPGKGDTFQDSLEPMRVQHSYEYAPGASTKHVPEYAGWTQEQRALFDRTMNEAIAPEGRDRLVAATGGPWQPGPQKEAPGFYNGEQNRGYKSYSLAPNLGGGMEPQTAQRLNATEATRAVVTGQEMGSAALRRPAVDWTSANEAALKLTGTPTGDEMSKLQEVLDEAFGPGQVNPEVTATGVNLVFWDDPLRHKVVGGEFDKLGRRAKYIKPSKKVPNGGVRIELRASAGDRRVAEILKEHQGATYDRRTHSITIPQQRTQWEEGLVKAYSGIADALGGKWAQRGMEPVTRQGVAPFLDWQGGNATKQALGFIDALPKEGRAMYDSAEVRSIMGDLAKAQRKAGGTPNPGIVRVLEAWSRGGLRSVRKLVQKGLAPAAAIGAATTLYNEQARERGNEYAES